MKNNKLLAVICLLIMLAIAISPAKYIGCASDGMLVFALNVIPSLFPFMFFSKLLGESGVFTSGRGLRGFYRLAGTPPQSFFTFLLSSLCGYPIGAKLTAESFERGEISVAQAKRMTMLCSCPSMIFVIGTVGTGMLKSVSAGVCMYLSAVAANIICAAALSRTIKDKGERIVSPVFSPRKDGTILYNAASDSVMSVFIVGGYIILFFVLAEMFAVFRITEPIRLLTAAILKLFNQSTHVADGICRGLLEFTGGCINVSGYGLDLCVSAPICAFLLSFGGASVALQSVTYLQRCRVSVPFYLLCKTVHGVTAAALCYPLMLLFN